MTEVFTALADPRRRTIIEMLAMRGELPVADINERFDISAPAVSQHLKVLRQAGLVRVRKNAQQRIYSLDPEGVDAFEDWASKIRKEWEARLDRLGAVLEEAR